VKYLLPHKKNRPVWPKTEKRERRAVWKAEKNGPADLKKVNKNYRVLTVKGNRRTNPSCQRKNTVKGLVRAHGRGKRNKTPEEIQYRNELRTYMLRREKKKERHSESVGKKKKINSLNEERKMECSGGRRSG